VPTAYVLINYEIGAEQNILNKLKNVPGVVEVSEVDGVYDIVVKIAYLTYYYSREPEKYYNTTHKSNRYSQVNADTYSSRIEIGHNNITKMDFGYNRSDRLYL
jgi:hypothetical protein